MSGSLPRRLARNLAGALVALAALAAVLLHLAVERQVELELAMVGPALAAQAARSLEGPLLARDLLSAQVTLDALLADAPLVARATLYSSANEILAQAQRPAAADGALAPFAAPVRLKDDLIGELRLELDRARAAERLRLPLLIVLALWLVAAGALGALWFARERNRAARLSALAAGLGASPGGDPLAQLERALAPFAAEEAGGDERAFLAVDIPGLPKWRAQLEAQLLHQLLAALDGLLDDHLRFFRGRRLGARRTALLLAFEGGTGAPAGRALDCALALAQTAREQVGTPGFPFELRFALAVRRSAPPATPLEADLERDRAAERLLELTPLAGPWETVVDGAELVADRDLADCQAEFLAAAGVWQVRHATAARAERLAGCIATLRRDR
ncbi:MAG: hypothetical protein KatS3mg124_0404 [Porticoccaceae bacterium]|nr:MAG: hypothetical protein KatS3mg124_0404 [Porticoccaceae bacterium]